MSHRPIRMLPPFGLAFRPMNRTLLLKPALPPSKVGEMPHGLNGVSFYQASLTDGVANVERALTKLASFYDVINIESSVALNHSFAEKDSGYAWAPLADGFPPHLDPTWIQKAEEAVEDATLFNPVALAETLKTIFEEQVPDWLPKPIHSMQDLEDTNQELHDNQGWLFGDMFGAPNVGLRPDWYTDAVFAQQHLTGPNPTTIKLASEANLSVFKQLAAHRKNKAMHDLLSKTDDGSAFYIQDYGDFRSALGIGRDAELVSNEGKSKRYGCAACCLFKLFPNGTLHPLAIVIDQKGFLVDDKHSSYLPTDDDHDSKNPDFSRWPMLFNRRLTPDDTSVDQKSDWPWRYAKMCVQTSDWLRHEVTVHLTETHLLEEAVIIAARRTLPDDNAIMKILPLVWTKTLSLNSLARSTLVPSVIAKIVGFPSSALSPFMLKAYSDFDWKGRYVPNDLKNRGFPPEKLNEPIFHNYGYARCINDFWTTLRNFVKGALKDQYKNDESVAADPHLQEFCTEMRKDTGGRLASFPESLKTVDEVVDMVTMIIHIASPQHTAVNYLQQYYQTFIANKPSALFAPLPDADKLETITEQDVLAALPVRDEAQKEWLLMAQLPYLLSFRVAGSENILHYAKSFYWPWSKDVIAVAARQLTKDLKDLGPGSATRTFERYNDGMDDKATGYTVLYPVDTAESILI